MCIFQFKLYFRWLFDDDDDGDFDNRRAAQSEKQITLGNTKSWLGIHLIHIQIGEGRGQSGRDNESLSSHYRCPKYANRLSEKRRKIGKNTIKKKLRLHRKY